MISAGSISRIETVKNVRTSPAPSSRLASSSSSGTLASAKIAREVDAERADDARQEDRPEGVGQLHLAEQEEQREREGGRRHQHAAQHDVEQRLATAEPVLGQRVAAHPGEHVATAAPTPA